MSSPLICCQNISKSYGSQVLFEELSLSVFANDRIGLIGPNGAGKSSLVKIILDLEETSAGEVILKKGLRIGYVPQVSTFSDISAKETLIAAFPSETHYSDHDKEVIVETWLTKLQFKNHDISVNSLSGGWKKRLAIARAMVNDPDIVVLDEPTNHLDLEATIWLETFLKKTLKTFILVSHDRTLLHEVTNRIVEINPNFSEGLLSIKGSYSFFLSKKEEALEGQIAREKSLASKVRREQEWLRSTPKARSTKSRSRIDQAYDLIDEHSTLKSNNQKQNIAIDFASSDRKTRKLITLKNVRKELGGSTLFKNLDLSITSEMRLGLIGPNGSGKSTLMKILMEELEVDLGTIKFADNLKCLYFDQEKAQLDNKLTLKEALSPNTEFVNFRGQSIHVNGWCRRFLFSPDNLQMPIGKLSGGERARLSIARLMLEPADVLLLDEPTNDLDIPTLETLEENLRDFPGAVILITHDRTMISSLCNLFLSLGNAEAETFASYDQWKESRDDTPQKKDKSQKPANNDWKDRKSRSRVEKKIEKEEENISKLKASLGSTEDLDKLDALCKDIESLQLTVDALYDEWGTLNLKIEDS